MWIESYKSKGKKYYRCCQKGKKPVHLGTAEAVLDVVLRGRERTHEQVAREQK
jgi:hypothetical protein